MDTGYGDRGLAKWHGGKGSSPRKVDLNKFDEAWERIFGERNTNTNAVSSNRSDNSSVPGQDVSDSESDGGVSRTS